MKQIRENHIWTTRSIGALMLAALLAVCTTADARRHGSNDRCTPCQTVAKLALRAELTEARGDYLLAIAKANTISDQEERAKAYEDAKEELFEATSEFYDIYLARIRFCKALGEKYYEPDIDPEDFLSPEEIESDPNPYLPLVPGTVRTYEGDTEDGLETIVVEVTDETREILDVECVVVRDTVWIDGELVEDTRDWFTQDVDGNVWYFGEIAVNYEDGEIADVEGSWEAGEDGAKPGIVMPADPQVGDVYRQEFLLGEAEDGGAVVALGQSVSVPYGDFTNCLQTADFTPLEPDAMEYKFYEPGVGLVLEINPESDERVELISVEN